MSRVDQIQLGPQFKLGEEQICLFVSNIILYEISFFIKIHVKVLTKVFYIQILFKCETPLLFFLIRTMVYRKKTLNRKKQFSAVDYVKIIELHIHTHCTQMMSHAN